MTYLPTEEQRTKVYDRKWAIEQLKQLRKEGYVSEGFKLTVNTYLLADEYYDAINRKRTHEAKLMQDAYECQEAFHARQAAQQELETYVEAQAPEAIATPLSCDTLEGWVGVRCDVMDRTACAVGFKNYGNFNNDLYSTEEAIEYSKFIPHLGQSYWYNRQHMEVYDSWQESSMYSELTCDILGSWYAETCKVDPDDAYNYQKYSTRVTRVIRSLLPVPDSLNLLRKLRQYSVSPSYRYPS